MGLFSKLWNLVNGYKTYIAGTSLLLLGLGSLFTELGHCIEDVQTILNGWEVCAQNVASSWDSVVTAFFGLGFIGTKHAIEKKKDA